MTSAGQIAISLGVLAVIAGSSLVGWVVLFRRAGESERRTSAAEGGRPQRH